MRQRSLLSILIVLLALGAWQAYRYFYSAPESLSRKNAAFSVHAVELVRQFETDSAAANSKYLGQVLTVQGEVASVDMEEDLTIILKTGTELSTIRCSMDNAERGKVEKVSVGNRIAVKGNCAGYTQDELLGSDIILNRCVIVETENK